MLRYGDAAERTLSTWQLQYSSIPAHHQALLPQLQARIETCRAAARQNTAVLQSIVHAAQADGSIGPALAAANDHHRRADGRVASIDAGKARAPSKRQISSVAAPSLAAAVPLFQSANARTPHKLVHTHRRAAARRFGTC